MNQQKPEVALERFEAAAKADASLVAARVNQAIAMTALQRYEPAQQILDAVVKADPTNVRAWYNLGLLAPHAGRQRRGAGGVHARDGTGPHRPVRALLRRASSAASCSSTTRPSRRSRARSSIDPFLVSAEFGLARSYQRSGKTDDAKTHMDRFTRLTQEKVASAMSLSYGDQGPLSLAQAVQPQAGTAPAAIAGEVRGAADCAAPSRSTENGVGQRRLPDRRRRRRRDRLRPPRRRGRAA